MEAEKWEQEMEAVKQKRSIKLYNSGRPAEYKGQMSIHPSNEIKIPQVVLNLNILEVVCSSGRRGDKF